MLHLTLFRSRPRLVRLPSIDIETVAARHAEAPAELLLRSWAETAAATEKEGWTSVEGD